MNIEREKKRQRQNQFTKNKTYFTYDYNGKIIQGKGQSKTASLSVSMKYIFDNIDQELIRRFLLLKNLKRKQPKWKLLIFQRLNTEKIENFPLNLDNKNIFPNLFFFKLLYFNHRQSQKLIN